jgi:peroxiredoxin
LNVQLLGISSNNPFSQKTFADSLQLPYPLLSDFPDLGVIRKYGGLNRQWDMTTAQRYFFLIDQQGIVRGKWRGETNDLFPSGPILKLAEELAKKR